jgi:hypothetical protein
MVPSFVSPWVRKGYEHRWLADLEESHAEMFAGLGTPMTAGHLLRCLWLALETKNLIRSCSWWVETWKSKDTPPLATDKEFKRLSRMLRSLQAMGFFPKKRWKGSHADEKAKKLFPEAKLFAKVICASPFSAVRRYPRHCPYCPESDDLIGVYDNDRDVTAYYCCRRCEGRIERMPPYGTALSC